MTRMCRLMYFKAHPLVAIGRKKITAICVSLALRATKQCWMKLMCNSLKINKNFHLVIEFESIIRR